VVFQAFVAIFAFDSVSTYWGVRTGWLQEWNPIVRHLIESIGLPGAMVAIFAFKSGLAYMLTRRTEGWATKACWGLLVFYVSMLTATWVRFFL
jgi:hypothetical protein